MEIFLKILLILHIISGFLSLTVGCIAIVAKKGKKVHRFSGKIFFYSMLGVTFSALVFSVAKNNQFLLLIAVFSFYQNHMGYRAIKNKTLQPNGLDWTILSLAAVNTFFMIYSLNIVLMVFGGISLMLAINNFRIFLKVKRGEALPAMAWLKQHIGMMMGAYIATITAFIVVNANVFKVVSLPEWLPWLLPSLILSPLIVYFTKKYTKKPGKKLTSI